jgi:hypothetical protein
MAETPISPESGATSGGTAGEDGTLGSPAQPPVSASSESLPTSVEPTEAAAVVEPVAAPPVQAAAAEPALMPPASPAADMAAAAQPSSPQTEPSTQQPLGVAATLAVPPLDQEANGGGEWELLVERLTAWWNSGELNRQWQRIRGPLKGVAILVVVLLALQLYATVIRTVDAIPVVSGLLELTGLIAVLQFSLTRLLRSSDREEVLTQVRRRWQEFQGRA